MNWNILVASGKEIKRDSTISVNESRVAYTTEYSILISKMDTNLFKY